MAASVYIIEGITGAGKDTICKELLELLHSDTRPVYYFPKETVGFYISSDILAGYYRHSPVPYGTSTRLWLDVKHARRPAVSKGLCGFGYRPEHRGKVDNGKWDRGNPVPNGADKGPRGESLTAMTQRLERERAEENRRNWLEHCARMYRTHVGIAQEWAQKRADILQEGVSRLAMPYARDSAGRRISMPGNATQSATTSK